MTWINIICAWRKKDICTYALFAKMALLKLEEYYRNISGLVYQFYITSRLLSLWVLNAVLKMSIPTFERTWCRQCYPWPEKSTIENLEVRKPCKILNLCFFPNIYHKFYIWKFFFLKNCSMLFQFIFAFECFIANLTFKRFLS